MKQIKINGGHITGQCLSATWTCNPGCGTLCTALCTKLPQISHAQIIQKLTVKLSCPAWVSFKGLAATIFQRPLTLHISGGCIPWIDSPVAISISHLATRGAVLAAIDLSAVQLTPRPLIYRAKVTATSGQPLRARHEAIQDAARAAFALNLPIHSNDRRN